MVRPRHVLRTLALTLTLASGVVAGTANAAPALAPATPAAPTAKLAWVGRVLAPVVARAAPSRAARARMVVQPIAPFAQGPTTLLITRSLLRGGVRWVEVLLPVRPNGSRGWIPVDVLSLNTTPVRIAIDLSDRRLTVYRAGRRALSIGIAVGTAATPTPSGRLFAIAELIQTRRPADFLGPIVMPLTGYSEALNEFAGGNGRVALHGTNQPGLIGSAVSHGCMRMTNADIVRLAAAARPGTPVSIRA
jgi:lipoprotein-anchoring transpeptidase ErfK/SrfK